jgi:hypothetical protein
MQAYFCLTFLFLVGVNAAQLRVYNNPLNGNSVDLFLLVDETNSHMNQVQLGQVKIVLKNIAAELQPSGSSPYFGVFFYGATSTVHEVVPFRTSNATVVKANLDLKQYTTAQPNPSTLSSALSLVDTRCLSYCRSNIPRVTVVFMGAPDHLAESRIRQLENDRGMTVIVVGIGSLANIDILYNLASHPKNIYAVPFSTLTELIVSTPYISFLISNVPRLLAVGSTLSVSTTSSGVYYTVQLNTYGYISTNDTVITYTTNCYTCSVYASLSEPNPTSVNTVQSTNGQYFYAPGYTYRVHYFRIPANANRFFLSFVGTGMSSVTGIFNIFNMPPIMSFSTKNTLPIDLSASIA